MEAESVKLRVALRAPTAVGLNTIVAEQLAETARLAPQVFAETAKSPAFAPVTAMLLMLRAELSPFVSETDCDALLEPTDVLA